MNITRFALLSLAVCQIAAAATYEVGPGKSIEEIDQVPWTRIHAGDTVLINARPEPYLCKWLISARGTESEPVTVRGVPGPDGQLPVISGINAVTPKGLDYWSGERSVIKIGVGSVPSQIVPSYVVVENLEVRGGRPPYSYVNRKGMTVKYLGWAALIFVEAGNHITVRNCTLHDGANGLFVSKAAKNVVIEHCHIYDNGMEKSDKQHNAYTEATGIIFQYNHFGRLRKGAGGNNIKDRSAGTVIRYNWVEGGCRELDLVDAEDSADIRANPEYARTLVYGNVLIEPPGIYGQIVHYGGDSGHKDWYRPGTLYFYNNTVICRRQGNTTLFRVQLNDGNVDCRNNIIYCTDPGNSLAIVDSVGQVNLQNNWIKAGWVNCHDEFTGTVTDKHNIIGADPGFVDEASDKFQLVADSQCINKTTPRASDAAEYPVDHQVAPPQGEAARATDKDLGAFGFAHDK